jgi:hypothetical protein
MFASIVASTDGPPEIAGARDRYAAAIAGLVPVAEESSTWSAAGRRSSTRCRTSRRWRTYSVWHWRLEGLAGREVELECLACGDGQLSRAPGRRPHHRGPRSPTRVQLSDQHVRWTSDRPRPGFSTCAMPWPPLRRSRAPPPVRRGGHLPVLQNSVQHHRRVHLTTDSAADQPEPSPRGASEVATVCRRRSPSGGGVVSTFAIGHKAVAEVVAVRSDVHHAGWPVVVPPPGHQGSRPPARRRGRLSPGEFRQAAPTNRSA